MYRKSLEEKKNQFRESRNGREAVVKFRKVRRNAAVDGIPNMIIARYSLDTNYIVDGDEECGDDDDNVDEVIWPSFPIIFLFFSHIWRSLLPLDGESVNLRRLL